MCFHGGSGLGRILAGLVVAGCMAFWGAAGAESGGTAAAPALIVFESGSGAAAGSPAHSALPAPTGKVALEAIGADPLASGLRIGRSAPTALAAALEARALSVALPASAVAGAGAVLTFTGVDVAHHESGLVSLYAQDAATDSEVALVAEGADLLGSIRRGDETWKVQPLGGGATAVYRYDTSGLRRHPPKRGRFLLKNARMQRQAPQREVEAEADSGDVIDLMVAYTPKAREETGNIDAFIQFAIDNTHRIYRNSNVGFRLRLVHAHEVDYSGAANMEADLDFLTEHDDGKMDEIGMLREYYGADLVALFVERPPPSGGACGIAWVPDFGRYPNADFSILGFSVTAHHCETSTNHTFAHELGHNQGADHNPANSAGAVLPTFPYRHGRCNVEEGWNTTMSYPWNEHGPCEREIEYLSSPNLRYQGTPTGDAAVRDNRRVLLETARRVANFRQSRDTPPPLRRRHIIPLVTAASHRGQQSFVRIINHSDSAGTVDIHAVDDTGRRFGPVSLSIDAQAATHFNSRDLEAGNPSKGLSAGVGSGSGQWYLELSADVDIEALSYIRTADGFLTSMHEVASESAEGSNRYYVPFFNPGSNASLQSFLRLVNPGAKSAGIVISGVDSAGDAAPGGEVRLTLEAGAARLLSARALEQGGAGFTGRLGDGQGKWRLDVVAERSIRVMSLLQTRSGHLSNLSRGRGIAAGGLPPLVEQDLVVRGARVDKSGLRTRESTVFRAQVHNQGPVTSLPSSRLHLFLSRDASSSRSDVEVGIVDISNIAPSTQRPISIDVTVPVAGTYYYRACVDVGDEWVHDIGDNCSSPVRVRVSGSPGLLYGAIVPAYKGGGCDNFHWGASRDYPNREAAASKALSECRRVGGVVCGQARVFRRCGAVSVGVSSERGCVTLDGTGANKSAAERLALSHCRSDYADCRLLTSLCNTGVIGASRVGAQSGQDAGAFPFGASESASRPESVPMQ